MRDLISASYAAYKVSCIRVYSTPDDGLQLDPKYVTVNKFIKLVICVADLIHMAVINCRAFIPRPEVFTARYDLYNYNYMLLLPSQLA
jgi:hypothetical protein